MKLLVLPNLLLNPVYVSGLSEPLLSVADAIEQSNPGFAEFATALRYAAEITNAFSLVNLEETHKLIKPISVN